MSKKNKDNFKVITFYRFVSIQKIGSIKKYIEIFLRERLVRGTILISKEGINGSISGSFKDMNLTINYIKKILKIRKINININDSDYLPFNRIKVRLKDEIIGFDKGKINVNKIHNNHVDPSNWNKLINQKNVKLIDTRNNYEIGIGRFYNSINPQTSSFREFPKKFEQLKINKTDKLALYCTGGIRCEKAAVFLQKKGFKRVYQLKGGVLNYLNYTSKRKRKSLWYGECFVFDERVAVNNQLIEGNYMQCYGCRRPITKNDMRSKNYIKGVQCSYCYKERTKEQKKRSLTRQLQIEKYESKGFHHTFKKINKS